MGTTMSRAAVRGPMTSGVVTRVDGLAGPSNGTDNVAAAHMAVKGTSAQARLISGNDGGDEGTRTPDPLLAKEVLSQLSYIPTQSQGTASFVGAPWSRSPTAID